jgi:hypothetical protein
MFLGKRNMVERQGVTYKASPICPCGKGSGPKLGQIIPKNIGFKRIFTLIITFDFVWFLELGVALEVARWLFSPNARLYQ